MQNPSTSSSEHPLENHQLPSTSSTVETLLPESNGDLIKKKKKHNNRKKKKNKKKEKKEDGKIKKKKRKRKKKCRKLADYISGGVHRFFRDLQVISLDKYQKLKEEYKGLQQEALRKVEEERENQMDQLPDLDV
uniref:Uncharacterized protein n=1 Tax=Caenorhabditis japonica TaxID=281687 RepID=A0A8R1E625_CAEJA